MKYWECKETLNRIFPNCSAEQKADPCRQLGIYGSQPEARRNIRKLRRQIRVRDGIIRNKMAKILLVVEAFVFGQGVGRVKWTISSAVDSSELSLDCQTESLSQDLSGGGGVAVGPLLGVRSSGRVGDLGAAGRPSWLSISTRSVGADILRPTN